LNSFKNQIPTDPQDALVKIPAPTAMPSWETADVEYSTSSIMARRHPFFRQRCFADDIVSICVRPYLRLKLSYRDPAKPVQELATGL
jgi:hypothetical protein